MRRTAVLALATLALAACASTGVKVDEADLRAAIGTEAVRQQIAEITLAERPRETMGDPERAAEPRHPQSGWQRNQGEVRLRRIDRAVVGRGRRRLRGAVCRIRGGLR